jgi:hypothetical protein
VVRVMNLKLNEPFTLSPRRPEGEGRERGADVLVRGATHLTLPSLRDGPLPPPPEGRRGALIAGLEGESCWWSADG